MFENVFLLGIMWMLFRKKNIKAVDICFGMQVAFLSIN